MGNPINPPVVIPPLAEHTLLGTSATTFAILGQSNISAGVCGQIIEGGDLNVSQGDGVLGTGKNGVHGQTHNPIGCGVLGENLSSTNNAKGLLAGIDPVLGQHTGVYGESDQHGVFGRSTNRNGTGVYGYNKGGGFGLRGESDGCGVQGQNSSTQAYGLLGGIDAVFGQHAGVYGESDQQGVFGRSTAVDGTGVYGYNKGSGFGVRGESEGGTAVQGHSFGPGGLAGKFIGDVEVTGDIRLTSGQDCAEDFNICESGCVESGMVMVIEDGGELDISRSAYDKRVAGVISGAGDFRPGIILGKQASQGRRMPIALLGKVYCKADASYSPIHVGDLLTSSQTPGHAMKAVDPVKAFGCVIGKALARLDVGQGLIPVLVALQ